MRANPAGKVYLETPRLTLRQLIEADVPDLVALDGDPEVTRYVGLAEPTTPARALAWLRSMAATYYEQPGGFGFWAIAERDSGRFIGWAHLRPVDGDFTVGEIGYRLRRDVWGRGYATELARGLLQHGFDTLGLRAAVARAAAANIASVRVLEKAGMRLVRRFETPGGDELVEYRAEHRKHAPP